jgi:hypothetical protein
MQKHYRVLTARLDPILGPKGCKAWVEETKRHPVLIVVLPDGRRRTTPFASSPKNADAAVNMTVQRVKKFLREEGLV